jgi:hypothetical protein
VYVYGLCLVYSAVSVSLHLYISTSLLLYVSVAYTAYTAYIAYKAYKAYIAYIGFTAYIAYTTYTAYIAYTAYIGWPVSRLVYGLCVSVSLCWFSSSCLYVPMLVLLYV